MLKDFHNETVKYIEKKIQESDSETKEYIKKILGESKEETNRYIGALSEGHQHTLDAILENTEGQQEANEKIDMMFEHMGKQEVDIAVLKESARDHERRLQKIER